MATALPGALQGRTPGYGQFSEGPTRLAHLREALGRLRSVVDVRELADRAVRELCQTVGFDRAVLFGVENECLTALACADGGASGRDVRDEFLRLLAGQAPSLPGPGGLFNGYGRVYADVNGHIEFASAECASPYELPSLVDEISGGGLAVTTRTAPLAEVESVWTAREEPGVRTVLVP